MIRDIERHVLNLRYLPNKHIIMLGSSGYGKTFSANQEVAHRIRDGDRIVVLDNSGSYTLEELARAGNVFGEHFYYCKADEEQFVFSVYSDNIVGTLTDALVEAFEIKSYNQETLLEECCEDLLENRGKFSFRELFKKLEERQWEYQTGEREGISDVIKNVNYLLNKFRCLRNNDNLIFMECGILERSEKEEAVTILQLSDFSGQQKRRISVFMLSLIWINAKCKGKHSDPGKYDAVLIDEFQHFPLAVDSSLTAILREGRKYNFSAIVCSQYLSDRKQAELSCLMQAGTVLLFRPTENEVKLLCKLFGLGEVQTWKRILIGLDIGEAILIGAYSLGNGKVLNRPLIVRFEDDADSLEKQETQQAQAELEVSESPKAREVMKVSESQQVQEKLKTPEVKKRKKSIIYVGQKIKPQEENQVVVQRRE